MTGHLKYIAGQFFPGRTIAGIAAYGTGHINDTYRIGLLVDGDEQAYLLQRINQQVFRRPEEVMANIQTAYRHLAHFPELDCLLQPLPAVDGQPFFRDEQGEVWRVFPFFAGTFSPERAESEDEACEAARVIGRFLSRLSSLDPALVYYTIPDFHHSLKRLRRFDEVVRADPAGRKRAAQDAIAELRRHQALFEQVDRLDVPLRVVHNDTKISNVLFQRESGRACGVIDWDTIMPGTLLSDFGDLVRSAAATLDENAADIERVEIDMPVFDALCRGFIPELRGTATPLELEHLVTGARWITLEQALRFLTDFLEGDPYYKTAYSTQNLVRARNQLQLFRSMRHRQAEMERIAAGY